MKFSQQSKKTALYAVLIIVAVFLFLLSAGFVWAQRYTGRIAPGVQIGPIDVGGMHPELAQQVLQSTIDELYLHGVSVRVNHETKVLALSSLSVSDLTESVEFSLDHAIVEAQNARRSNNLMTQLWLFFSSFWNTYTITIPVSLDQEKIQKDLLDLFADVESPGFNAGFQFLKSEQGWKVEITPSVTGQEFDWETFFADLNHRLANFDFDDQQNTSVYLSLRTVTPTVTESMANTQTQEALTKLLSAPLTFSHTDERGISSQWTLTQTEFSKMIIPGPQESIAIDQVVFNTFLDPIADALERPAQNARFEMDNGRVVEFLEAKTGQRLDRDLMHARLLSHLTDTYTLAFVTEEPAVQTSDINDLGVDQILGVGTSSYRGSPINRRKNIQNGVNLLNGLLIAPGETFSLLDALKPFDVTNGYVPELVIKGTKIIPEIGGGLCQIGTTTFRAAMNAGLPIVERRNHSLVVSYYNDPSNNNPGTDATIYDPSPDFKFLNDTGHYILFQAENLVDTQELRFTFWGTSDGRKGSYSPPVVTRWIPVGETQYIETTDLKPGEQSCQAAHIGADASFEYLIVRPDGTIETTTFDSHYRPLPKICLVGVEELSPIDTLSPVAEPLPVEVQPSDELEKDT